MILRSDSTLAQLTDDQQAQVFDWLQDLGYSETIKKLALPPPDGFGIKTYRASLHAFFVRYAAQLKVEHAASAAALAVGTTCTPAFVSVSEDALHHSAFQLSTSPIDLETFKELSRWITKHKSHEQKADYVRIADEHLALARERLALEREKFQFNAAREALNHHTQLGQILADPHADDEAKIHAARERIFGKESIARIDAQEARRRNPV